MGFELFGNNEPTKEEKIAEIDRKIERKKEEWRQAEEKNYDARMNYTSSYKIPSVDYVKLDKGDRDQQSLKNVIEDIKRETQYQMDLLKAEIDELEKEKSALM